MERIQSVEPAMNRTSEPTTPTTPTIKITAGIRADIIADPSKIRHESPDDVLDCITKESNLYEVIKDTDTTRTYGDIDLYAKTKKEATALDAVIEKALRKALTGRRFCLMTASGTDHANKSKGKYKVSWRFVLTDLVGSLSNVKRFVLETLQPKITAELAALSVVLPVAVMDGSVYKKTQKMRLLGSSKDGEVRPLRLVEGSPIDSLITYIPADTYETIDDPQPIEEAPKPTTTAPAPQPKPRTSGAVEDRAWDFIVALADIVPLPVVDGYDSCCEFIWALWNEEQSERMEALLNKACSKSPKYKVKDSNGNKGADWVRSKINQEQTGAKRIGSVVYWVQKAEPEKMKALHRKFPRLYINELFGQSLKPQNVIEYDSRYVKPLPIDDYDTIALSSHLGTGKTAALMGNRKLQIQGLLARRKVSPEALKIGKDGKFETAKEVLDFPRVLFVSGRKSFTNFALGELDSQGIKFETYSEHHGAQLAKFDRLFIQVESLWKLADGFQSYDMVIVDESETIAHQLHSIETNRDNMIDNHIIFERCVASARKVIAADAFLSDRTFSILKELRNPKHTALVLNKHQPYKRTATEIQPTEKDERIPNTGQFVRRVMEAIKAKRKIVVVWTSKRKGLAFEKDYLEPLREAGLRWKYYHGDSTKADRADLADVGKAWADLDVLMYTTSISVGISYDAKEERLQFEEAFLWACAASATPRDIAQALLRCRTLKLNRLTYVIDGRCMPPQIRGFDALREYVKEKKKRIQADHPVVQWKSAPKWAEDNYIYNENECRVSKAEYKEVLRFYLRWCGYVIGKEGGSCIDYNLKNIDGAAFDEIEEIDGEQAEEIRMKMQRDEAEPMERLAYKKFRFLCALKEEKHDGAEAIWNDYMENIGDEMRFWNMVKEKHTTTDHTATKESEKRYLTMAAKHLEQRTTLDKLLKMCGLKHSQEEKTIKAEDFAKLVQHGATLEQEVRSVFGIRKSERKGGFDVKALHDMLASVWGTWSGADVITTNERRLTIDGKRVRVYDYQFQPRTLWEAITDRSEDPEEVKEMNGKAPAYAIVDE
jgi:hypothetical protein